MALEYIDSNNQKASLNVTGEIKPIILSVISHDNSEKKNLVPNGWLLCDGTEYNLSEHPEFENLANLISPNRSDLTKFIVPNLTGRTLQMGINVVPRRIGPAPYDRYNKYDIEDGQYIEPSLPNVKGSRQVLTGKDTRVVSGCITYSHWGWITRGNAAATDNRWCENKTIDFNTKDGTEDFDYPLYRDLDYAVGRSDADRYNFVKNNICQASSNAKSSGYPQPEAYSVSYIIKY